MVWSVVDCWVSVSAVERMMKKKLSRMSTLYIPFISPEGTGFRVSQVHPSSQPRRLARERGGQRDGCVRDIAHSATSPVPMA